MVNDAGLRTLVRVVKDTGLRIGLRILQAPPGELKTLVDRLFDDFAARVGLEQEDPLALDARETAAAAGVAISPLDAARCLRDPLRTARFLRGVEAAVLGAREAFPRERIRVLYAGCGPFAPLAVLLAPRFDPADVEFVLLDLHRRSLEAAAVLVEAFGLGAFIGEYVEADASVYRCPDGWRPHVVVSETMQRALAKEPQVSIVMNLAPQLVPGGRLVPEEVTLRACLFDPAAEFGPLLAGSGVASAVPRPVRVALGDVFQLSSGTRPDSLHPVRVVLPDPVPPGPMTKELAPMIQTAIRIQGDVHLGERESGLTMPAILHDLADLRGGQTIEFRYRFAPEPGLSYRVV